MLQLFFKKFWYAIKEEYLQLCERSIEVHSPLQLHTCFYVRPTFFHILEAKQHNAIDWMKI